ncbi:hypothetical protein NA57DRAFT_76539 [Rhizodiscina lignyota]|uniref:Uncharacterized protein n=1 Tax=Rhizodiscina lignyota TaxID=1504668 RepID=A0A9P4I9Z6_9PEZI|nr:hypothetical protein NA57DRAFT_76539 [Rhizodiscina lignyota]
MGIPYSKEINAAFDQVTPLVAAAYQVLQTTKNISIILAGIQVLTLVFLGMILVALVGLLFTMNPDLEKERQLYVTPTLLAIVSWAAVARISLLVVTAVSSVIAMWLIMRVAQHRHDVTALYEVADGVAAEDKEG